MSILHKATKTQNNYEYLAIEALRQTDLERMKAIVDEEILDHDKQYGDKPRGRHLRNFYQLVPAPHLLTNPRPYRHFGNTRPLVGSWADSFADSEWHEKTKDCYHRRFGLSVVFNVQDELVEGREKYTPQRAFPYSIRFWNETPQQFDRNIRETLRRTIKIPELHSLQKQTDNDSETMNNYLIPSYTMMRALGYGPAELYYVR